MARKPTCSVSSQRSYATVVNTAKKDDPTYNVKPAEEIEKHSRLYGFKLQDYSKPGVTNLASESVAKSSINKGILIFILH